MTLQQMKYAITVADYGSLNQAASALFISQPSLSGAIKALEEETCVTIFLRNSRGITITPEGEEFLGYARQVVDQYRLMEEHYVEKKEFKRHFAVSMQHYSFAVKAFVELVQEFGTKEYEFAAYETTTHEVIEDVKNFRSEVGVLYRNEFNEKILEKIFQNSEVEFIPLFICKTYVYLWKGHPLANRKGITFEELEEYPALSFDQGANQSFFLSEEVLSTHHYKRTVKVNDRATMLNLMVGLNGYTLCSGIICEELNGNDYLAVPFLEDAQMEIGYVKRVHVPLSSLGKLYIERLSEYKNLVMK